MSNYCKSKIMKTLNSIVILLIAVFSGGTHGAQPAYLVELAAEGKPVYHLNLGDRPVLQSSALGLVLSDRDLSSGFDRMESSEPVAVKEEYTLVHGKQSKVSRVGKEVLHRFYRNDQVELALRVRTFDDGVAFRYEIEGRDDGEPVVLKEELTSFAPMPDLRTAVVQQMDKPGNFTPAYEYHMFMDRPHNREHGFCFPMLFQNTTEPLSMLLTEAGLTRDHSGTRLLQHQDGAFSIGLPSPGENPVDDPSGPSFSGKWASPWRLIIVGESLGTIVESTLVTDVSSPTTVEDTSWVRPGFASWSWWSESSPKDTAKVKTFIDLAAEQGWEYSLVDANWSRDAVPELVAYAKEKGVELMYWYNSGGDHNTVGEQPRNLMVDREIRRKEMAWLQDAGVVGIKVDFFNSDKQTRIQQYLDILEDAAEFKLMVNFHGNTLPRGWERTYPHLMTMEAVRGGESYKFAGDWWNKLAPMHNVNVALTRNVVGPTDYTPGIVSRATPKQKTITTAAHELALGVVLTSGITHWCDSVESYRALDPAVRNLLSKLPRTWDETRFIQGAPRDLVVLARRSGDRWWFAGISGSKEPIELVLPWDNYFAENAAITVLHDIDDGDAIGTTAGRTVRLEPYGGFVAWEGK